MYYANLHLTPTQAKTLQRGGAIKIQPHLMDSPNIKLVVSDTNARKLLDAQSRGGATKLKLSPSEMEYNSSQKRGGLGPLAMLAASTLLPAIAPAVGNAASNIFGRLLGGGTMGGRRHGGRRR